MRKVARAFFYDKRARENIFSFFSSFMNLSYSVYNLFFGVIYEAPFLVAIAAYYLLVMLIRLRLLSAEKKPGEKTHTGIDSIHASAYLISILSIAMALVIVYTVNLGAPITYSRISVTVFGAYGVYSIIRALIGFFTFRASSLGVDFLFKCLRISLALLSLFNLLYLFSKMCDDASSLSIPIGAFFVGALAFLSIVVFSRCVYNER